MKTLRIIIKGIYVLSFMIALFFMFDILQGINFNLEETQAFGITVSSGSLLISMLLVILTGFSMCMVIYFTQEKFIEK